MIQFNEKLKNYKSKNFGILTLDGSQTKIKDDAYSIDVYDENHFFVGVYITNPFIKNSKEIVVKQALKDNSDYFHQVYRKNQLCLSSFSYGEKQNAFAFKFLIDLEGNVNDFAINKEEVHIDYELNDEDIEYLIESDIDDLRDEEVEILHMLEIMHTINDLIYMKRTNGKDIETRDIDCYFINSFHNQLTVLANIYTAKLFYRENLPYLYNNAIQLNTKLLMHDVFYSSSFEENIIYNDVIGANTSPLRNKADAINLAIIDDLILNEDGFSLEKRDEWEDRIKNVKIIKEIAADDGKINKKYL